MYTIGQVVNKLNTQVLQSKDTIWLSVEDTYDYISDALNYFYVFSQLDFNQTYEKVENINGSTIFELSKRILTVVDIRIDGQKIEKTNMKGFFDIDDNSLPYYRNYYWNGKTIYLNFTAKKVEIIYKYESQRYTELDASVEFPLPDLCLPAFKNLFAWLVLEQGYETSNSLANAQFNSFMNKTEKLRTIDGYNNFVSTLALSSVYF